MLAAIVIFIGVGFLFPHAVTKEVRRQRKWKARLIKKINRYSDSELDDFEIFEELVQFQNQGDLVRYASERLRGNRELILKAVEYPNLEPFTDGGGELVLDAKGSPLEYASSELQNDREVVLRAIEHSSYAFKLASPELRGDPEVIWAAANRFRPDGTLPIGEVLDCISEVLFSNHSAFYEFLVDLYDGRQWELPEYFHNSVVEDYIDPPFKARISELLQDREILVRALDETEWASRYAPQEIG